MHVTGKGAKEFLELIDTYETNAQKKLREKLLKSNRSLFSFILRPTDKVFTAKGGSINFNLPQQTVTFIKDRVSDVADGFDIKKYLKKVVKKQYVIDPNGILFIDIDSVGKLETYIINSSNILWYSNKGNKVNGLIFEPTKRELSEDQKKEFKAVSTERLKIEEDKMYYRVIDEKLDRIFVNDGGTVTEVVTSRLDNFFGFVPAIILGDEKDPNTDLFESIIGDIVEDADMFLRRVSVTNVHEMAHLYPRYWSYEQACTRCEGEGTVKTITSAAGVSPVTFDEATCVSCGGGGSKTRTNPDDEIVLQTPMEGEPVIAPDVAGYVQPDLESAKFYVELIEKARNTMFQAMWGTTYEQGGKRETATGRFLDAQPVQDRLRDISDTFARFHKFMLDCYGKVLLNNPRYETSVSYGTRYILESADDMLDKYIEGSRENISEVTILDLKNRYFEAEYQNDVIELIKRKKLLKVEPFPTMRIKDVVEVDGLSEDQKNRKLYYSEWVSSLNDAQLYFLTEDELRKSLTLFIKESTNTNTNK